MTAAPLKDPWVPTPMEVQQVIRETADTVTLTLDASARPLHFAPGQFNMLFRLGFGEVPISISGDPAEPDKLVHTIRSVGATSHPLTTVLPGDVLGVRGPYGSAWPVEAARGSDVLIVAGGIGLAPLRPAILQLLRNRAHYARVLVLYGARNPADLLFLRQLHHWRGRFDLDVQVTVDRAPADWFGPVGVVTRLMERARFDPDDTVVMTCGPEVMMRFVVREAEHQGVPPQNIYLSMERNMKCAVALCGHCLWGPDFVCKDGAVFRWDAVAHRFDHPGL